MPDEIELNSRITSAMLGAANTLANIAYRRRWDERQWDLVRQAMKYVEQEVEKEKSK
jgi:hypothetical protein